MFRQDGDRTKISVRTRDGGLDATVLTGIFGGGGHARAAGRDGRAAHGSRQDRRSSPRRAPMLAADGG